MVLTVLAFLISFFCAFVYMNGSAHHSRSPVPYPQSEVYLNGILAGLVLLFPLSLFGLLPAFLGFLWAFLIGLDSAKRINELKKIQQCRELHRPLS
jgi:hypothetical protein